MESSNQTLEPQPLIVGVSVQDHRERDFFWELDWKWSVTKCLIELSPVVASVGHAVVGHVASVRKPPDPEITLSIEMFAEAGSLYAEVKGSKIVIVLTA